MRRVLRWIAAGCAAAAMGLAWTFLPLRLPAPVPYVGELPPAHPPASIRVHVLDTGAITSPAALSYRGGAWGEQREFAVTALLVEHPRGHLLIDAGLGLQTEAQVQRLPALARALAPVSLATPTVQQLPEAIPPDALAGVLLTHAHWDHVSALEDLRGVPVWVPAEERAFVEGEDRHAELARSFGIRRWHEIRFDGGEYLGFARSHDVWGDGAVVVVPAPGHTPGSVIVFLALPDGLRVALLGDLVWQREGIERPAERPWLARASLGEDAAAVREQIARIAALQAAFPGMLMIPAHDRRAWEELRERDAQDASSSSGLASGADAARTE